jgi:hypothetical protein
MTRKTRRMAIIVTSMALVFGGATAVSIGVSQAGESCDGLDAALRQNLNFIAGQRRQPDAQSAARIANRQAVVDLIQLRRRNAGCTARIAAAGPAAPVNAPAAAPATTSPAAPPAAAPAGGQVVCAGSSVTLFNEDAPPAATSGQFPIGTRLKVTNLDNNKSITVTVTGVSGSCALLNNAAFDQVHEPGKNLIRRAVIQRVG